MDLTLVDETFLAAVNKLDGIFDSQDMRGVSVVEAIDHGG